MQHVVVLWAVSICFMPTPTYGCRGLSFTAFIRPPAALLAFRGDGQLGLSTSISLPSVGRSTPRWQTQSMQPGLRPGTLSSRATINPIAVRVGPLNSGTLARSSLRPPPCSHAADPMADTAKSILFPHPPCSITFDYSSEFTSMPPATPTHSTKPVVHCGSIPVRISPASSRQVPPRGSLDCSSGL
ncbi:hypothetical protein Mal52_13220 [Symmachiella dynata]|uniref:Uncharacterized protein n=1 Tax=Symmachiella dynata TaxID=2527995 RepID=A0A517ZKB2_9PLAN|nr:hypothetical protein Mal52_13220 [Symmachiella dynata]